MYPVTAGAITAARRSAAAAAIPPLNFAMIPRAAKDVLGYAK